MKKILLTAIAAGLLAGCTATPEMIEAQKSRCTQVGYQPGSEAHALCTERGTMQQQQAQSAMAVGAGASVLNAALIEALW